jgi:hypothetical protein
MDKVIANQTWSNFFFPDWVPEKVREEIKSFWSERWGRGPAEWYENAISNKAPLFGDRVRVHGVGVGSPILEGRIIFAWNNIGRLIADDGSIQCVAIRGFEVSRGGMWRKPRLDEYANENEILPFYARS